MIFFAESTGGLSALGLNWQSFLFQLISFVIVLVILRVFVFKKIVATLDARRSAVENSVRHATETEEKLRKAEDKIMSMLDDARKQADDIIVAGHKQSALVVEAAEQKAAERADHIVAEAKNQLQQDVAKARDDLKAETMNLVSLATAKIIKEKLDAKKDNDLVNDALATAKGRLHG